MPKIDVNKVAEILKKNHIDPAVLRRVVEEMNLAVQPDPGEGEAAPPVKKQFVILVRVPRRQAPEVRLHRLGAPDPRGREPGLGPGAPSQGGLRLQRLKEGPALSGQDGGRRPRGRACKVLPGDRALGHELLTNKLQVCGSLFFVYFYVSRKRNYEYTRKKDNA